MLPLWNILKWGISEKSGKSEFAKYGHCCDKPEEQDDVATHYAGDTAGNKIKKFCFYMRMVSDISKLYTHHLRSHGAIVKERKRHLLYYNYMIHPYSYFRVLWEFFMIWVMITQFFLAPIDAGFFGIHTVFISGNLTFHIWLTVNDIFFLSDVGVNIITGYYSENQKEVVLDLKRTFLHYLKTLFIPDLLSSLPFHIRTIYECKCTDYYPYKILSLLKLLRLPQFFKYYHRICNFFGLKYSTTAISSILIGVIIFWHTLTCNFMLVQFIDSISYPESTFDKDPLWHYPSNTWHIYVKYFYKSSMVIYTSWYTRDYAQGPLENSVVTFMWYFSKAIQFYILARTLQIMKGTNSSHQKYIEMERQLKEYMRDKQLPAYMRARLLMYYDFRFQRHYFRESEILSTISGQLRQEIIMHSCRQLVENVAFFKNLPINLLVRIVSCLRGEIYLINDVIVRANTQGDCMYFIASGTVAVYSTSGKEICHLEDGDHFGEVALVTKAESRIASVIAIEISEVYRFDTKDFIRAIHPYPDLLNSIEKIANERLEKTAMLDEHNRRELATKRVN